MRTLEVAALLRDADAEKVNTDALTEALPDMATEALSVSTADDDIEDE